MNHRPTISSNSYNSETPDVMVVVVGDWHDHSPIEHDPSKASMENGLMLVRRGAGPSQGKTTIAGIEPTAQQQSHSTSL